MINQLHLLSDKQTMSKTPEKPVICRAHFNELVFVESAEHNHTTLTAIIIRSILERTGIINF